MIQYRLESLKLHNFKLFEDVTIPFDSRSLTILDGPNGYGKTSVFDAIEYVLTGTLQRAAERKELNNAIAYETDFLTRDPSDGTPAFAQATFRAKAGDTTLIVRRTLRSATGRANNPKQLSSNTDTTIIQNGETILENKDVQTANTVIGEVLGQNVLRYFEQYFYISQEDRISFLSKSEKDRMTTLQHLFNMEVEEAQYAKLRDLKKKFGDLKIDLQTALNNIQSKILELEKQTKLSTSKEATMVAYERLVPTASRLFIWDQEIPQIGEQKKLLELQEQVRGIDAFTRQFPHFLETQKNEWLETMAQDTQGLLQFLFLLNYVPEVQAFYTDADRYHQLKKIVTAAELDTDSPEYEKIDFIRLSELLKIPCDLGEITHIHEQIEHCRKNMQAEDKARVALMKLQEQMDRKRVDWLANGYPGLQENECPFCGHPWPSAESLQKNVEIIHAGLAVGATQTQIALDTEQKKLQTIYEDSFQTLLKNDLQTHSFLETDTCKSLYLSWNTLIQKFENFRSKCAEYQLDAISYCLPKDNPDVWIKHCENFSAQMLRSHMITVPSTYIDEATKYDFIRIFRDVFTSDPTHVLPIAAQTCQNKLTYLEQQYFLMQSNNISKLREQGNKTKERQKQAERIHNQVSRLEQILKDELREYKKKVVTQLQIPFYLYTGRIIQNYPGGLGILISVQGTDKIHFEAFERRGHDVLYTLSSGQLSALAIALTLTLNRIYAQDTFRCVLIDDPIQTMDELNVSSFVELLRNDFQSYQFVLSTHEDDFSDYIRYKFEKYRLANKSIIMRDL